MRPKTNVVNVGPQMFHSSPSPDDHDGDNNSKDGSRQTIPLEPLSMSPQLANALEHIVSQLDILTQVSNV